MTSYDVFLSHASADKAAVEALARKLRDEAGLAVFFDRWELVPGTHWQEALEKALEASQTCAVFLGPQGLGPWHTEEIRAALNQRLQQAPKRVIPVLLPEAQDADIPPFLRQRTWVDFRDGLDDDAAFEQLVAGIRGVAPGAGSPQGGVSAAASPASPPQNGSAEPPAPRRGPARKLALGTLVGLLGVLLTVLAWCFPPKDDPPPGPELYALRVQVLDPEGRPVEGSTVRTSAGNEPHLLPDGWWQVEIPAAKVPADGRVTLWAEHPRWQAARRVVSLGEDRNPSVEIRLEVPDEPILGDVVDAQGRAVVGARVVVRNAAGDPAVSDQDGRFELRVKKARDQQVRIRVEHADFAPKETYCWVGGSGCSVVLSPL